MTKELEQAYEFMYRQVDALIRYATEFPMSDVTIPKEYILDCIRSVYVIDVLRGEERV